MEARQEVRLKEAEAADQKKRLTETRSLYQPGPLSGGSAVKSRPNPDDIAIKYAIVSSANGDTSN
jgi:hypothetical protein